jgi:hypothetical protein
MKQRGENRMRMQEARAYMPDWDEVANLDAWEGYEFWSSQLEAEMEFFEGFAGDDSLNLVQLESKEVRSDALPF